MCVPPAAGSETSYGARHSMPVHCIYELMNCEELTAYYRGADIIVISPLADGMNLVAKEYVASRVDVDGILLLGEFAGATRELDWAVLVNPYDIDGTARAILTGWTPSALLAVRAGRGGVKLRGTQGAHSGSTWSGQTPVPTWV